MSAKTNSCLQHELAHVICHEVIATHFNVPLSIVKDIFMEQRKTHSTNTNNGEWKNIFVGALSHALAYAYFLRKRQKNMPMYKFNTEDIQYYDTTKGTDIMLFDMEVLYNTKLKELPVYLVDVKTERKRTPDIWYKNLVHTKDWEDADFLSKLESDINMDLSNRLRRYGWIADMIEHQKKATGKVVEI